MNKKLLIGVFGLGLMLSTVNVNAQTIDNVEDGTNSASANVTVWDVETPVYNVNVFWNDLTFNWYYNAETESYGWEKGHCIPLTEDIKSNFTEELYSNMKSSITTERDCNSKTSLFEKGISYEEAKENLDSYYMFSMSSTHVDYNDIRIEDNSTGAKITPSIEWTSAEGYDWTIGEFYEMKDPVCLEISEEEFDSILSSDKTIYTDSSCFNYTSDRNITWEDDTYYYSTGISFEKLTTTELPDSLRQETDDGSLYHVSFKLNIDETKEKTTPKIGDTIGTITISIK